MPAAVDVADFYEFIKKPATEDQQPVARICAAATRAAESRVGPIIIDDFISQVEADGGSLVLPKAPVVSVETIEATLEPVTTWLAADVAVVNAAAGIVGTKYVPLQRHAAWQPQQYRVTYKAGRFATPVEVRDEMPDVYEAVLIIARHLWELRYGKAARPGLLGEGANNEDAERRLPTGFAIPARARDLLAPYSTPAVS